MLFNSAVFLQFFAAFLLLYGLVREHLHLRNALIVAASYVFYGWWDVRFLGLLVATSFVDYGVGLGLGVLRAPGRRRALLAGSIVVNLIVLGFFKYYDFFVTSCVELGARLGVTLDARPLGVILPVGISFYTFQSMSYALDVYRGVLAPTRNLVNFLAYVAFFPQLVAGPIERGAHLLPQFERTLRVTREMVASGLWLMISGMFKKVVLADNLAPLVDLAYGAGGDPCAAVVIGGTLAFAAQIYCDFLGYSDIARGTARVLGFELMRNFDRPYAAANVREFWRRWHISLSTWLRDYLYIGLGGNRHGAARTAVNLLLTMLLGGLWHGAAWHFVLWGAWHGLGLVAQRWWEGLGLRLPRWLGWCATMLFVLYGWLLFRAGSAAQVYELTLALGDFSLPRWAASFWVGVMECVLCLAAIEWLEARWPRVESAGVLEGWPWVLVQGIMLFGVLLYWDRAGTPFVYFQF
jgi:D-alanyl-lipoteichoic acid acyltransferase DltB (MBOAT superfamily)